MDSHEQKTPDISEGMIVATSVRAAAAAAQYFKGLAPLLQNVETAPVAVQTAASQL